MIQSKKDSFVTGTRADYGKLKPILKLIEKSKSLTCIFL